MVVFLSFKKIEPSKRTRQAKIAIDVLIEVQ